MTLYGCPCEGTVHDKDCPFSDDVGDNLSDPTPDKGMGQGWKCPSCGRGNAPWLATCPCHQEGQSGISTTGNWQLGLGNTTRD